MFTKLYTTVILLLSISGVVYYAYNHYVDLKSQLELKTLESLRFKESLKAVSYTHLTLPTTPYV